MEHPQKPVMEAIRALEGISAAMLKLFSMLETASDVGEAYVAPGAMTAEDVIDELCALDAQLGRLFDQVELHQEKWKEMQRLGEMMARLEKADMEALEVLDQQRMELEAVIDKSYTLENPENAPELDQIIDYAAKIAPYTRAPRNFDQKDISQRWHLPYPDEQMMNTGWLRTLENDTELQSRINVVGESDQSNDMQS